MFFFSLENRIKCKTCFYHPLTICLPQFVCVGVNQTVLYSVYSVTELYNCTLRHRTCFVLTSSSNRTKPNFRKPREAIMNNCCFLKLICSPVIIANADTKVVQGILLKESPFILFRYQIVCSIVSSVFHEFIFAMADKNTGRFSKMIRIS